MASVLRSAVPSVISRFSSNRTVTAVLCGHGQQLAAAGWGAKRCMSLQADFDSALERLKTLKEDPGNVAKLELYALFKQSTEGAVQSKRPGMMNMVARAKWDAWKAVDSLSKEDAKTKYISIVDSFVGEQEQQEKTRTESGQTYNTIKVEQSDKMRTITLNRPKKFNAVNREMYAEWQQALEDAAADPGTVLTVMTGAGRYYCAGNDLSNFADISPDEIHERAEEARIGLLSFVATFIDFPKPLVAVVNGPAVGVPVTLLGLFDLVYSTDMATFNTPFPQLGQSPEGCSSYTFPRLMGPAKASQMLLFNKKITAREACDLGLVTEVFPDATMQKEVWPRLKAYSELPKNSLFYSKALSRNLEKDLLHKVNAAECERLKERWTSDDCAQAVMEFLSRKK